MPTKQDIDKGIAVNMAGTVPGGHGLGPIRQRLLDEPRERQWVIGEVVNNSTKITHPAEADDQRAPCIQWVDMTAITDTADCDQLAAMSARARARMMGQRTFEEADADEETLGDQADDADGGSGVAPKFLSSVPDSPGDNDE